MLKIYGVPVSVHTRKVIVAAIEKKLQFQNEPVIPFNPPPGWAELSPTGKIPVLTDGAVTLADSTVILNYLDRAYPSHPLYPTDTKDYLQALWLEEYADGTVFREVIHPLFFQKIIRPNILKQDTNTDEMDNVLLHAMPKIFGYLDGVATDGYLVGSAFGVADIAVMSNLINYHYLGFSIDAKRYPKLAAYFSTQLRQPSIASAVNAAKPFASGMGLDQSFAASLEAAA